MKERTRDPGSNVYPEMCGLRTGSEAAGRVVSGDAVL
jgi:hypothetical protein